MLLFLGLAVAIGAAAYGLPTDLRLWLGHAYLVAGYRLPAFLVGRRDPRPLTPNPESRPAPGRFESWLMRTDARWFPFRSALPLWAAPVLELSYLFCYVVVPAAFVFIWTTASATVVDRFWTAVLVAGFACYGLLPWLVILPPRVRVTEAADSAALRRLNLHILRRASHGFNTFPSGHVAVSLAAGLALLELSPSAGAAALVVALAIAVGAAAGRYHYVIDVLAGVFVGAAASLLT